MKLSIFRNQLKWIMKYAWRLFNNGIRPFSEALRYSWKIVRSQLYLKHTKLRGVSHYQANIKCLLSLPQDSYKIMIIQEICKYNQEISLKAVAFVFVK